MKLMKHSPTVKLACMTWPYTQYSFERALEGISRAGYRYVSFGLPHENKPAFTDDANGEAARIARLLERYRLEPVTLVSTDAFVPGQTVERIRSRLEFAKALGVEELLSLGTTSYRKFPGEPCSDEEMEHLNEQFARQFQIVGEEAARMGLTVTIKPHTGNTATASILAETLEQIGSPAVKACYDPGNVRFYEGVDPLDDFQRITDRLVSFIAKDHQGERAEANFPIPGEGDVDFPALFAELKSADFSGPVIIERLDGAGGQFLAEDWDYRIERARLTLQQMLLSAGFEVL